MQRSLVFGAALAVAVAAAIPVGAQTPGPHVDVVPVTPTPAASGIPTIGTTRTSYCKAIFDSSAIASAAVADNDKMMLDLIDRIPSIHLDTETIPKRESDFRSLRNTAAVLRQRGQKGLEQTAKIRAYARTLEPAKRDPLLAYADAMDNGLRAEMTAGEELQRAMMVADGRREGIKVDAAVNHESKPIGATDTVEIPDSYASMLKAVSERFDDHHDEVVTAVRDVAARSREIHC